MMFYFILINRADIGVIGLAVMGQNLILNMNDHGFVVCAFNRSPEKVTAFLENEAKGTQVSNKVTPVLYLNLFCRNVNL